MTYFKNRRQKPSVPMMDEKDLHEGMEVETDLGPGVVIKIRSVQGGPKHAFIRVGASQTVVCRLPTETLRAKPKTNVFEVFRMAELEKMIREIVREEMRNDGPALNGDILEHD